MGPYSVTLAARYNIDSLTFKLIDLSLRMLRTFFLSVKNLEMNLRMINLYLDIYISSAQKFLNF
jgi:hypothetical protein